MTTTAVKTHRSVRAYLEVRDDRNVIIGRCEIEAGTDGKTYVYLQQTYGGSADGTQKGSPIKCDLEVLKAIVEEASKVDAFAPAVVK